MAGDRFDLVVIGGGAGGLTAARESVRRGARTLLVQDGPIGGDCTFTGCVPSKTLLAAAAGGQGWSAAMSRVRGAVATVAATEDDDALAREGVEVRHGRARVVGPGAVEVDRTRIDADHIVVATGATPLVPPIPGLADVGYLTSDTVFDLTDRPRSLAILGGGPIGCELAQAFSRLGVPVTLVEAEDRVLTGYERQVSAVVAAALTSGGVDVRCGATVTRVERVPGGRRLVLRPGGTIEAAELLVAVGRRPAGAGLGLEDIGVEVDDRGAVVTDDTMAASVEGVWAAGDVAGRDQLTHAAGRMAIVAVANALSRSRWRRPSRFDETTIALVTFTDPEVAQIGLTEAEAADQGGRVAELPFTHLDRAVAAGRTEGYVKLIAGPRKGLGWTGGGRLLGASIVGPTAGELIHEAALAMSTGMFTGRLAQTTHAYPSWSMAIQLAAAQFFTESQGHRARPARPSS